MSLNLQRTYPLVTSQGIIEKGSLQEVFSRAEETLLYVYPRDNTPGCTLENKDFSCMKQDFQKLGIQILGLSQDTIESHTNFQKEHALYIDLLSDPELILHKELGAYGEKNNYGKMIEGVIRSTYLFQRDGTLLKSWKNVKATGHAAKVFREISIL